MVAWVGSAIPHPLCQQPLVPPPQWKLLILNYQLLIGLSLIEAFEEGFIALGFLKSFDN